MPSIRELVAQFGGEQEAAYTAFRQVELMVTRASAPGKEAEKAQLAAELAGELWAMTEAKKDEKDKDVAPAIRYPLEARIKIDVPAELAGLVEARRAELCALFIVSDVEVGTKAGAETAIAVEPAPGSKCQRCWNYATTVGASQDDPDLCRRCQDVVKGAGG